MEETEISIVPADRQTDTKPVGSTGESTQKEPKSQKSADGDSKATAGTSSESAERPSKSTAGSKKHGQRKKKKEPKGAKSSLNDEEAESSDSSDTDSNSDSDDDESPVSGKSSKKHISLAKDKKKKKKKATSKKSTSGKEKKTGKKANKKKNKGKKRADTPSDSEDDSDSDSSDSSSSNERDDEEDSASSSKRSGLKDQFKALQLQVSQLQLQLSNSNSVSALGAPSINYPMQFAQNPWAQMTTPQLIPPPVAPGRGRPGMPPSGFPGLSIDSKNDDTSDESDDETSESKNKKKKGKKGQRPAFKRVDQVWDNSIHNYKLQDTADADSDSQYEAFIFHVRRTFDWEGKYRTTVVDIRSKLLRECLQDVIGNVEGVSLVDEIPKIDPNLLFLYLEDLRGHLKALKQAKPAGETKKARKKNQKRLEEKRKHLKVIIKYLDHDYESTKESLYPMLDSGLITFDLLWALWKPNTLAYTTTYGCASEPRVFKVEMAQLHSSIMKGNFYYVEGKYFEFDGKRFGFGNMAVEIDEFQGARKITSLPCYPLNYHQNEEKVRTDLIERGKKFVTLSGVHYKSYQGIAFMKRKKNMVVKFNIQPSRVMVDPTIFRRINPNYNVSLVKPKDHDILSDEEDSDSEAECCCEASDSEDSEKVKYVTKLFKDQSGNVRMARIPKDMVEDDEPDQAELDKLPLKKGDGEDTEEGEILEFTDEEYLIASPVVLGFAFSEKQWLEFTVSGLKDIKWNEKAWDSLVLEDGTKDLIKALVESRKYHAANTIDDVIQGKGKGLVTVLHGPPGTGKTLTAEGISELLKCPLYMASAGELGTDSRFLEAELQKILDICHAWGAILLLDEADVFLEKRNMHDIHRNALVSIFLRQLEYFQGILFLTTNRVETFDEAFQSRIHIALRYDNLDAKAKRTIFKMFLDSVRKLGKIEVEPISDDDLQSLSRQDLNGREIKNVVGSAQDLAVNKGEALSMRHIKQVLNVHAKFSKDLQGGTGYEDAMRSYF
ncbi:hypothetical protein FDECE_15006 [Fusarium decemcellulare]|nr:hypothetical protein FDECE_15006 [Fusarium decemcellulare]